MPRIRTTWLVAVAAAAVLACASRAGAVVVTNDPTIASILANRWSAWAPGIAAAVVVNGNIYSNQYGERRRDPDAGFQYPVQVGDRWQMGSISKVISGEWLARYVDAGYLSWNTRLNQVFAIDASNPFRNVTLAQFMSHTSGMPGQPYLSQPVPGPPNDYDGLPLPERRVHYMQDAIQDVPLYPPGTIANYDGGVMIATAMLEQQTSQDYEYLLSTLLIVAGMTNTNFEALSSTSTNPVDGVWSHAPSGGLSYPDPVAPRNYHICRQPAGGVTSTIVDMAKFLKYALSSHPDLRYNVGLGSFTPMGWSASMQDAAGGLQLAHSGSDGNNYALAVVWPARGVAIIVASNSNSPNTVGAVMSDIQATLTASWSAPAPTFPYPTAPTLNVSSVAASNTYQSDTANWGPAKAFDGTYGTRWATDNVTSAWIRGSFATPAAVSGVVISEGGPFAVTPQPCDPNGNCTAPNAYTINPVTAYRVTSWSLYLYHSPSGSWLHVVDGSYIGHNRRISFGGTYNDITAVYLYMSVGSQAKASGGPTLQELHLTP